MAKHVFAMKTLLALIAVSLNVMAMAEANVILLTKNVFVYLASEESTVKKLVVQKIVIEMDYV